MYCYNMVSVKSCGSHFRYCAVQLCCDIVSHTAINEPWRHLTGITGSSLAEEISSHRLCTKPSDKPIVIYCKLAHKGHANQYDQLFRTLYRWFIANTMDILQSCTKPSISYYDCFVYCLIHTVITFRNFSCPAMGCDIKRMDAVWSRRLPGY